MKHRLIKTLTVICMAVGFWENGNYQVYADSEGPLGTKIDWSFDSGTGVGTDISVSCTASDACTAFLDAINQGKGTVYIKDVHPGGDNTGDFPISASKIDATSSKITVPSTYSFKDWLNGATHVHLKVTGYSEIQQGVESWDCEPIQGEGYKITTNETYSEYYISIPGDYDFSGTNLNWSIRLGYDHHGVTNASYANHVLTIQRNRIEDQIASGYYTDVYLLCSTMNDPNGTNYKFKLNTPSGGIHFDDISGGIQWPQKMMIQSKDDGLYLTCSPSDPACPVVLQTIYDATEAAPVQDTNNKKGFVLYEKYIDGRPASKPYYFPNQGETKNIFTRVTDENNNVTGLHIAEDVIKKYGINEGTTFVFGEAYANNITAPSTGLVTFEDDGSFTMDKIVMKCGNPAPLTERDIRVDVDPETFELIISSLDDKYNDFLDTINVLGIGRTDSPAGNGRFVTVAPEPTVEGTKKSVRVLLPSGLQNLYAMVGPGDLTLTIEGEGYSVAKRVLENVNHPFRPMPTDVGITVIGDGIKITSADEEFLKVISESVNPLSDAIIEALGEDYAKVNSSDQYGRPDGTQNTFDSSRDDYSFTLDPSGKYVIVPVPWNDLDKLGAGLDKAYYFTLTDSVYGTSFQTSTGSYLNPIRLSSAAKKKEIELSELSELDRVAITSGDSGLHNVTVAENNENNNEKIELIGEVAASISTDNNGGADNSDLNYEDPNVVITVATESSHLTDSQAAEIIEQFDATLTPTDVQFDLEIKKSYSAESGKEGKVTVSELPYPVALEFKLPEEDLESGEAYYLLREHEGFVGDIPVETFTKDGEQYGRAYSDQFSSYVLAVGDEKVDPDPAPKPAPADDSSKKPSSSGSAKKTSPVKTDNVVTCQMAGYPANYAWNESAKACQPGFIDNAGVFHGTAAVNKTGVPNTYDKGLMGNVWALMISVVTGVAAAYALKKY